MRVMRGFPNQKQLRILVVGAGGIGCEIAKNLIKSSHQLTFLDYDIISISNLNRQFCYRNEDVGKHKVDVLKDYFSKIDPNFRIQVEKANLLNCDQLFFNQFDILISALDNKEARLYLNKMAIDKGIPMIDAGTSGYNGQAQIFVRGITQCKMCRPQNSQQKALEVCTLRGKPEKNIHCIHFAIQILEKVLKLKNKQKELKEINLVQKQWHNLQQILNEDILSIQKVEMVSQDIHNLLFYQNPASIQRITMQQGVACISFSFDTLSFADMNKFLPIHHFNQFFSQKQIQSYLQDSQIGILEAKVLPMNVYSYLFVKTLPAIILSNLKGPYDKDNFLSSLFIFCAANLRILNFCNISTKLNNLSYYQCKDISGKIIPAIASTNSIAAGLQLILLSRLKNGLDKGEYLSIKGFHPCSKIQKYMLQKPKQGCYFCSAFYNYVEVQTRFQIATWGQLEDFLCKKLDDSLLHRDLRCDQYVILRNTRKQINQPNKLKPISSNLNLVKSSKNGEKYMRLSYIQGDQPYDKIAWKIILINNQTLKKQQFRLRKADTKQRYQDRKIEQLLKITNKLNTYECQQLSKEELRSIVLQQL